MKKLINTIEVHELRAKRALFIRKARELEKEAMKYRTDALQAGCELVALGEPLYDRHPVYKDVIYPLLRTARNECLAFGFDLLYQTRTPIPDNPDWTEGLAGIIDEPTGTMQGCLDLIAARPELVIRHDSTIAELLTPAIESDNSEKSER